MTALLNLDLLSVGIAVAGIGVLGLVIFLNNRQSITNKTFLFLSISIVFWSIFNYLAYQFHSSTVTLWLLRLVIFFAVWFAFLIFQFLYVFPQEKLVFSNKYKFLLIPLVIFTSLITLTPFVFSQVASLSQSGGASRVVNSAGIILFGVMVMSFNISGLVLLIRKIIKATGIEKIQFKYVLFGFLIMLSLIVVFNFIMPAFFDNPRYIPLGAVFLLPFVIFTAYAIFRHGLLNVRVIATEILAFVLSVVTLFEVILSQDVVSIIFRAGVFLLVFGFSILLIKSVRKEVEQREQLQTLTLELEEFVGFAAHQVKGPMANMKGYAQLIEDGTYGKTTNEIKEAAIKIKGSADQAIQLVTDLLNVRKIESGEFMKDFNFEPVNIVEFLRAITEEYKIVAHNHNLELTFESPIENLSVKIDKQKIHEVIKNLVENSIKYTPSGFIKIGLTDEGKSVLICVSDSGRGLSKELQAKLFQRFMRDEQTKREIQGTGLGLYIAKEIVTAHKGNIWAESDGEGKGSKFYVRLSKNIVS